VTSQRSRRPAGDHTGRQSERLAREAEPELQRRSGEITTVNPAPGTMTIDENAIVDVTNPHQPAVRRITDDDVSEDERREVESHRRRGNDVVEVQSIEVGERTRLMRVSEPCNPTIGFGPNGPNDFNFEPGLLYRVPEVVYDHLDAVGYVYH
jgi:hypothetical protein